MSKGQLLLISFQISLSEEYQEHTNSYSLFLIEKSISTTYTCFHQAYFFRFDAFRLPVLYYRDITDTDVANKMDFFKDCTEVVHVLFYFFLTQHEV